MKANDRIVIIGGGFAGLQLARKLNNSEFRVTLIDRANHHMFQPLFYQVASAGLDPSSISFPFRKIFQRSKNIDIRFSEVTSVDSAQNILHTSSGPVEYDRLVIATGCKTNFFGNEEIGKNALGMKSTEEAIEIRNKILTSFEELVTLQQDEKPCLLNIVIVGAGPTGVELAGAFAEMKRKVLPKDYPRYDFSKLNIILVEGSDHTLNNMSDKSKKASRKYLENMGVQVKTGTVVKSYDGRIVALSNGEQIPSCSVIWAAGITGNLIQGMSPESQVRGRYTVDRLNRVSGYENIYALGDIACMKTPKYPNGHPQVANVAINQGKNLGRNFFRMLRNNPLKEYEYRDMGSMATVGKHKAVVELPGMKIKGRMAWYIWMFLHLMLILSVKNKLIVFINWAWSYITYDNSLRLILRGSK